MTYFIGIDPGLTGAVALLDDQRGEILDCFDIPTEQTGQLTGRMRTRINDVSFYGALKEWSAAYQFAYQYSQVAIEQPIAMGTLPAQTVASQFDTFGAIRGICNTFLVLRRAQIVAPKVWKGFYGLKADKQESIEIAKALYPSAHRFLTRKKDHNRAEAVLLAHWLRRQQ